MDLIPLPQLKGHHRLSAQIRLIKDNNNKEGTYKVMTCYLLPNNLGSRKVILVIY